MRIKRIEFILERIYIKNETVYIDVEDDNYIIMIAT